MQKDDSQLKHEHIVEKVDPEARIFVMIVAALMIAEVGFGLLNGLDIIHM